MTATTCTLDLSFAAYVINSMSDAPETAVKTRIDFQDPNIVCVNSETKHSQVTDYGEDCICHLPHT